MKTSKIVGLLTFIIINFSTCDLLFRHHDHMSESVVYNLGLNFQDGAGNDLVEGIGLEEWGHVIPDLYVLDIILSEPCENWDNEVYNTPARPGFRPTAYRPQFVMQRYTDDCYLTNRFGVPVGDCPEEKILTYKLKVPYVFGDEAVHEIVTYWDIPKKKSDYAYYAKCNRIEFEGKEIIPQGPMDKNGNYVAIIKLKNVVGAKP